MGVRPTEAEAETLWSRLSRQEVVTLEDAMRVFTAFGGTEGFMGPGAFWRQALYQLILSVEGAPASWVEDWLAAGKARLSRAEVTMLASHEAVRARPELFNRLWKDSPLGMMEALRNQEASFVLAQPGWAEGFHEDARSEHNGGTYRIRRGEVIRGFYLQARAAWVASFHPAVLATVRGAFPTLSQRQLMSAAKSLLVGDDEWAFFVHQVPRPVVSATVENPLLPSEWARVILAAHKSPQLRESIAHHSGDPELLKELWETAKPGSPVRRAVALNQASGVYCLHPEALLS